MVDDRSVDSLEEAFRLAKAGDTEAFARWMGMVELPLRRSLRRFARAVDVEVVVQEALVRMWLVAREPGRELVGLGASLKFAFRVARNVALEEIRRNRQDKFVDIASLDDMPEGIVAPDQPDPALRRAIEDCIGRLPRRPRAALTARAGGRADRELAADLRMKLNTFLQNIVRARRLMAVCLKKRGVRLGEILS